MKRAMDFSVNPKEPPTVLVNKESFTAMQEAGALEMRDGGWWLNDKHCWVHVSPVTFE